VKLSRSEDYPSSTLDTNELISGHPSSDSPGQKFSEAQQTTQRTILSPTNINTTKKNQTSTSFIKQSPPVSDDIKIAKEEEPSDNCFKRCFK
jgi:hypothetical protein